MKDDEFSQLHHKINDLKERAAQIKTDARLNAFSPANELLLATFEELSVSLEELQVSQEELYLQHEELLDTRQELEREWQRYVDLFENAPDGYVVTDFKGIIQEANQAAGRLLNVRPDLLASKPLSLYMTPEDRKLFYDRLSMIADPSGFSAWELTLQPRHVEPTTIELNVTILRDKSGQPEKIRWLLHDVSHRKDAERYIRDTNLNLEARVQERATALVEETRLKEEAMAREVLSHTEAVALRDIGLILNNTLDLTEVLASILATLVRLVPYEAADVMLLDGESVLLVACTGYDRCDDHEFISTLNFPATAYPISEIIRTGQPVLIADLQEELLWVKKMGGDEKFASYVGVPIFSHDELIGFINLMSETQDLYTPEYATTLQAFSVQAALAIRNAQLHEQSQAASILEERNRLARDLHDAVSQSLFTASIIAETLLQPAANGSASSEDLLRFLLRLTRGAQAEMRTLLLELRPAHMNDVNLPEQLRRLVDALWARKEIQIDLELNVDEPMPPDIQLVFYRIAQEALNNISKHSHASKAHLMLTSNGAKILLNVEDNGRGFDQTGSSAGIGLETMKERAEAIRASFEVKSAPDKGTLVVVEWQR